MNDSHSPRGDAADGSGRDRRPDGPYGPYDPSAPDPPAADRYQQPGTYGQDPYGADRYPQQADPYGQDAYGEQQYRQGGYGHDPYGAAQQQTGYAEPYSTGWQQGAPQQQGQQYGYDPGQYDPGHYEAGQVGTGQVGTGREDAGPYGPDPYPAQQQDPYARQPQQQYQQASARTPEQVRRPPAGDAHSEPGESGRDDAPPEPGPPSAEYQAEQFSFVEDEEENEEVIDWLKFAETRTERRDERRRRGRNRVVALAVVLALALVGGVGYLWQQNGLPFLGEAESAAPAAAQKRDVIVVHLKELDSENSSTALLVHNETAGKGSTVLLPNSLAISTDGAGSTTLGKSVDTAGAAPTRESLSALLGADIKGTWRLDTPFLELLVELVGGIRVDTDTAIEGTGKNRGKLLVEEGGGQQLGGVAAVAYATHRAPGEAADRQLTRFGQVMEAVLKELPGTAAAATETVRSLGAVPDPSLPDGELGASLAPLAEEAKSGRYRTVALSVREGGVLDERTARSVVRDVLGGTVGKTDPDAPPSVRVENATGRREALSDARVALVNSGYTVVSGGRAETVAAKSRVEYSDPAGAELAREVAQTLGLPSSAVRKAADEGGSTQIRVVLGQDHKG